MSRTTTPRTARAARALPVAVALTAVLGGLTGLSGCTGGDEPSAAVASGPPAIQPGRPGEPNTTGAPSLPPEVFSQADVAFATDMIPHHAQALEMSGMVPGRGSDERVRAFASRVYAEQEPEIRILAAWLEARDQAVPVVEGIVGEGGRVDHDGHGTVGGHDHAGMPGMATPEELTELAAMRGVEFDERFLEMMVRHHEGAIEMVLEHGLGGRDVRLSEIAGEVQVTQAAEIDRMQDLLAES